MSDESLLSLISRLSEFQQFDYNVPQCGSSCLFCLKFIYVLGCLRSYLASNLGCFSALNFSSDFFSLQQLYFPAPKFLFLKILNYQKKKGQNNLLYLYCSILLRQLTIFWGGSFVYQFEHLFQTNLFLVTIGSAGGTDCKESTCNAGDLGLIPGLERSPGGECGNPLQYSCPENPHGHRSLAGYSP